MLRRIQGAIGTAITWAILWAVGGFALFTAFFFLARGLERSTYWETARQVTMLAGVSGFVTGILFSILLATVYRNRTIADLKPLRMAAWGALTGVIVPIGVTAAGVVARVPMQGDLVTAVTVILATMGAATAAGVVKLAQGGAKSPTSPTSS